MNNLIGWQSRLVTSRPYITLLVIVIITVLLAAGAVRCKVIIGRHHRYRKYNARKARKEWREGWTTGSPVVFPDVSDLIAVMEKRGSVNTPYFEHFANRQTNPAYMANLKRLIRINVDVLTDPFTGANNFKPEIVPLRNLEPTVETDGDGNHSDE